MYIKEGILGTKDSFEDVVLNAKTFNEKYNAFSLIMDKYEYEKKDSLINGICYGLKDNFSTKGILTTACCNLLKDYVPVYDSTVYTKLKNSGGVLAFKTTMDELAMGGSGVTGNTGIVRNPWNKDYLIGGSSSGSAACVAGGIVPFAIGSDTGDSIRKPASFAGIVGFKPTYGRISRYGLFAFASSLDHAGVLTRSVADAAIVTDILKGYDPKDMTSIKKDDVSYYNSLNKSIKGKKLFYIKEYLDKTGVNDKNILKNIDIFYDTVDKIRSLGIEVTEVSISKKLLDCVYPCYFSISCAEATSNNSNLTGILFGDRKEGDSATDIMINTRSDGFSKLIKRRFILGSYILQKENQERLFKNALRIRRLIVSEFNSLFDIYDGYILPTSASIAPKAYEGDCFDKIKNDYCLLDNHAAIANFGGFPSISIPYGMIDNMPVGLCLTCSAYNDELCLNIANNIESILGFKNICAGGDK
ncbi:MAG: amidase family protein [Bacilli bacterium]